MDETYISNERLRELVDTHLNQFYSRQINKLNSLQLDVILERKNPYLYRALGIETPSRMVEELVLAYISSSNETIFGDAFFEAIIRDVARVKVIEIEKPNDTDGPTLGGIDIVLETSSDYVVIDVKSGTKWANNRQSKRLKDDFDEFRKAFLTDDPAKGVVALVGQCYGRTVTGPTEKKEYYTLSGQAFWTFITGDSTFYRRLIMAMGDAPDIHNAKYKPAFEDTISRFTGEFSIRFCNKDGRIDWEKVVSRVSGVRRTASRRLNPLIVHESLVPTDSNLDRFIDALKLAKAKR